ncbi:MAG: ligase-associated DNA damage response endonuclease PdeM [Betaproteobacteria bacterium]
MQVITGPDPGAAHAVARWADETVHLLPAHAMLWPSGGVLFVADLHLGKAATYRAFGQPVPSGSTLDNLQRLSRLIALHAPRQLVFLGDFLHGAAGRTPALLAALLAWRGQHATLMMTLVRGNHDRRAGNPPPEAGFEIVEEPWLLGPFACCHHPQSHASHFVLAGHEHPVLRLHGPARDRLRLPCFVRTTRQAILPAFGNFTGGHPVFPGPECEVHVVGGERVWLVPAQALQLRDRLSTRRR